MKIREANYNDTPQILKVLKASLGETSSKKTEEVWRYKHIDNPFGESLVLVAEEEGEIVGVRAFMRWKWQKGEQVYSAFRAVDTATHPAHQGKGIFKKLTLKALELAKERGDHFVFNTPNEQSKPGYFKMGWKEIGKVRTTLLPVNPIFWFAKNGLKISDTEIKIIPSESILQWNRKLGKQDLIFTPKTQEYLNWRYLKNPLQTYKVAENENFFVAGYIKNQSYFKELRVSEVIINSHSHKKSVKKEIQSWAKESGANFISCSSLVNKDLNMNGITGNFGPVLTFKSLTVNDSNFLNISSWAYSLGDLELF